ncbi:MAG: formylglycine-generating enzyme family protein [Cyanobacteriota bacterium]|nr:formylglycine-generating enzyme family protein [Cyanobacteriota bacterium]
MPNPAAAAGASTAEPWQILRWQTRQLAYRETLAKGVELTLLRIPAGRFWIGAPEGEEGSLESERPVHAVELGEFLLGRTPVTQAQWRAVAQWQPETGQRWSRRLESEPSTFTGENRPVVNVSWHDAMEFCRRLRQRTGKHYRLPSEAQWEYACRAGTTTPFHFGETISTELANYNGNYSYGSGNKGESPLQTTDVASFPANAWGLHDMHGNVWEWCADHWHDEYGKQPPVDGGPWLDDQAEGRQRRLLRGGSWNILPVNCRSAYRGRNRQSYRNYVVGFRVCCLPQDQLLYP